MADANFITRKLNHDEQDPKIARLLAIHRIPDQAIASLKGLVL